MTRSSMHEKHVKALLVRKSNIDLTCTEFYENIKSNVVLLKKVLGTDKYERLFDLLINRNSFSFCVFSTIGLL